MVADKICDQRVWPRGPLTSRAFFREDRVNNGLRIQAQPEGVKIVEQRVGIAKRHDQSSNRPVISSNVRSTFNDEVRKDLYPGETLVLLDYRRGSDLNTPEKGHPRSII